MFIDFLPLFVLWIEEADKSCHSTQRATQSKELFGFKKCAVYAQTTQIVGHIDESICGKIDIAVAQNLHHLVGFCQTGDDVTFICRKFHVIHPLCSKGAKGGVQDELLYFIEAEFGLKIVGVNQNM